MFLSAHDTVRQVRIIRPVLPVVQTRYSARLALDTQTRAEAYKLRYESYLASGYIQPNETGLFQDLYDDLPNCQTVVIYDEGVPAASVRVCTLAFGSRKRSPASDAFPEEVRKLLNEQTAIGPGARGIETNSSGAEPGGGQ